jgi:threonine synthase
MKYISTRGDAPALSFEDVVLAGLASDGGLYVPETMPTFSQQEIASWSSLSYPELAFKVMQPFVGGEVDDASLRKIIDQAYDGFSHSAIAPMVQTRHNEWVLELFHGPTLAFKDFALQFLGLLLDHFLKKRNQKVAVLGATSGDTGSAAIEGCRNCENIDIFILHPHQRVSEVQRRQMTTVLEDNVFNIAVKGNFDDCQNIVKAAFRDQSFLPEGRQLVAVNSINWARIMAQIVYYFYSALALGAPAREISFSVPTGNFGDIFAGYLAGKMGLPVKQLIIATNQNDILHRCISQNDHSKKELIQSLSPSMDIMVSSNFERLLFDLYEQDGQQIQNLIGNLADGSMTLSDQALDKARELFVSHRLDDQGTVEAISSVYKDTGYVIDPHTATGIMAARETRPDSATPVVCLATAHPAKFPDAIEKTNSVPVSSVPAHMSDLFEREESYQVLENSLESIQDFMTASLG